MLLGNVLNQNPAEWKQMMDTNVLGVLNGMQIVLPQMVERQGGTVINMSSLAGKKLLPITPLMSLQNLVSMV